MLLLWVRKGGADPDFSDAGRRSAGRRQADRWLAVGRLDGPPFPAHSAGGDRVGRTSPGLFLVQQQRAGRAGRHIGDGRTDDGDDDDSGSSNLVRPPESAARRHPPDGPARLRSVVAFGGVAQRRQASPRLAQLAQELPVRADDGRQSRGVRAQLRGETGVALRLPTAAAGRRGRRLFRPPDAAQTRRKHARSPFLPPAR